MRTASAALPGALRLPCEDPLDCVLLPMRRRLWLARVAVAADPVKAPARVEVHVSRSHICTFSTRCARMTRAITDVGQGALERLSCGEGSDSAQNTSTANSRGATAEGAASAGGCSAVVKNPYANVI